MSPCAYDRDGLDLHRVCRIMLDSVDGDNSHYRHMRRRTGWTDDFEQVVANDSVHGKGSSVTSDHNCDQAENPSIGQGPVARRDRPMIGVRRQCPAEQTAVAQSCDDHWHFSKRL